MFFARVRKKTAESLKKSFKSFIHPKKKVFLDKALWNRGIQFWQPCLYFFAKRPIFLQISREKIPSNSETTYRPVYVFTENENLPKTSARLMEGISDNREIIHCQSTTIFRVGSEKNP